MKRFHVNVAVNDLKKSTRFYSTLFGKEPTVLKDDYAKWMLDDPRINFSLSASDRSRGINHLGLQVESITELTEIRTRLDGAGATLFDQADAECCYAKSTKTWVRDPDEVAWETFVTHGEITDYGNDLERGVSNLQAAKCCKSPSATACCA